jgi:hypothetical protein
MHNDHGAAPTRKLGDQLAGQGYPGFFEVDYLVDTASGELYLGETGRRRCTASPADQRSQAAVHSSLRCQSWPASSAVATGLGSRSAQLS